MVSAKIMTVDDSEFERKLIIQLLERNDYKDVVEADSGEKAILVYKKEKPDLVLMDYRLPKMDGLECLKELKKINPSVKVIMLTIVIRKDAVDEAVRAGAKDYLVKPITEKNLMSAVKKVLG